MTAATRARELGTTLNDAAKAWGCTRSGMEKMFTNNRHKFEIVCTGVAEQNKAP